MEIKAVKGPEKRLLLKRQRRMLLNFKHYNMHCLRTCMSAKKGFLKATAK
jgi:hypothetical protein